MIRFLGNFSIRLWILALVAGPLCFYAMPLFTRIFPGVPPKAVMVMLLGAMGLFIGAILDFMGRKWIHGMINQGKTWERAGLLARAEKTYARAVGIYDTFLLSPWFARKTGTRLAGALARFTLISGIENKGFKLASAVYLKSHPEDETLAGLWLGQRINQGINDSLDQEVLTALADAHFTHKKLVFLLADMLLAQGRMDYSAKRLYRYLLEDPELAFALAPEQAKAYQRRIHLLLGEPKEPVEPGFGAHKRPLEQESTLRAIPIYNRRVGPRYEGLKQRPSLTRRASEVVTGAIRFIISGIGALLGFPGRVIACVREQERIWRYIRAGFMALLSVWLLFFMWNTFSHLLKPKAIEKPVGPVEAPIPKPFTIQVAAYLEKAHAERYLALLTQKEIPALIKIVGGGGKTWYVVRISEFPDKVSAAAYGNKLKAQKIIDDFFVGNK